MQPFRDTALADLGVDVPEGVILEWISCRVPVTVKEAELAISVAVKLGIPQIVTRLAREGPAISLDIDLPDHSLDRLDVPYAWARGYRVSFDGKIEYYDKTTSRTLIAAIKKGMPVKELTGNDVTDELIEMCPDLVSLDVSLSHDVALSKLHTLKSLAKLWVKGGRVETVPESLEEVTLFTCEFPDGLFDRCRRIESFCAPTSRYPKSVESIRILEKTEVGDALTGLPSLKHLMVCCDVLITKLPQTIESLYIKDVSQITNEVLAECTGLKRLTISDCPQVTKCPPSVQVLIAGYNKRYGFGPVEGYSDPEPACHIDDAGLVGCNSIRHLELASTPGVTKCPASVTWLSANFRDAPLDLSGCGALLDLSATCSPGITTCPLSVQHLQLQGETGIRDLTRNTNLLTLDLAYTRLFDLPPSLEILNEHESGLTDDILRGLPSLKILRTSSEFISICPPSVVKLTIVSGSSIDDWGLANCPNLKNLDARESEYVRKCPPTVEVLTIGHGSLIGNDGLKGCNSLRVLNASGCSFVTVVPPSVEELDASGFGCSIGEDSIRNCPRLRKVVSDDNSKVVPFVL